MAQHKLLDIVNKLLERSKRGEVNWHAAEAENTYLVTYSRSSFSISSDEVEPNYYYISVLNNEESVPVDSMSFEGTYDDGYNIVSELYDLAKRKSLGVDKVLDALLEEIEN